MNYTNWIKDMIPLVLSLFAGGCQLLLTFYFMHLFKSLFNDGIALLDAWKVAALDMMKRVNHLDGESEKSE